MVQAQSVIDEVIWVVGDEAILRSEVEEERLRAQYEGQQIKGDPYCVIPEQIAIQKLFLHQAVIDSVEANESTVRDDDYRAQSDDYSADAVQTDIGHQTDAGGHPSLL